MKAVPETGALVEIVPPPETVAVRAAEELVKVGVIETVVPPSVAVADVGLMVKAGVAVPEA